MPKSVPWPHLACPETVCAAGVLGARYSTAAAGGRASVHLEQRGMGAPRSCRQATMTDMTRGTDPRAAEFPELAANRPCTATALNRSDYGSVKAPFRVLAALRVLEKCFKTVFSRPD